MASKMEVLFQYINRLFPQSLIFRFSFITRTLNVPNGSDSHHSGEKIEGIVYVIPLCFFR